MASTSSTASSSSAVSSSQPEKPPEKPAQRLLSAELSSYFVAGGCAGAASRTVVSPLERLKIIQQVQPRNGTDPYKGVYRSLARMYKEEGFKGFMRGNGINCVRIIPYSAVQFTAYETFKKWFSAQGTKPLDTPTRLLSGAMAGICSVSATYPLDLCRARLSIASASILPVTATNPAAAALQASPTSALSRTTSLTATSASASSSTSTSQPRPALPKLTSTSRGPLTATSSLSTLASAVSSTAANGGMTLTNRRLSPQVPGMWDMLTKIYVEEGGLRALYRGIVPTAVGVAPYVGINFATYEWLRMYLTPPGQKHAAWQKLTCGALAGSISQTLTYPFDVLRRKMQVSGLKSLGPGYNGAFDAIRGIFKTEGVKGFYRGLWPNLLKVAPSIATSFYTYELVKEFLS